MLMASSAELWNFDEVTKMVRALIVKQVEAVEEAEPGSFEVRLLLDDASEVILHIEGPTLCSLADMVSQYATP
jgi:hypothetical protein